MRAFKRQNPMLVEMLINLLFFSVCACLLACVFAQAYTKSEYALSAQYALEESQSIAEQFKAENTDCEEFFMALGWDESESGYTRSYGFSKTEWTLCANRIELPEGVEGFELCAYSGGERCFGFNVEVASGKQR